MVKLVDRLMTELKEAMKISQAEQLDRKQAAITKKAVISPLRSALLLAEKEKKTPLTEQEETALVRREMKQSQQTLVEAKKVNRQDIILLEQEKIHILESYLPAQLSKEEVREQLVQLGIGPLLNLGDAMKLANSVFSGQVANQLLVEIIKELIGATK